MSDIPSARTLQRRVTARALLRAERDKQRARAVPENTARAYQADWRQFERWCQALGYPALPAADEVLCDYLSHLSLDRRRRRNRRTGETTDAFSYQATSIERKLSAIVHAHRAAGHPSPRTAEVTAQMNAIWRDRETKPRQAAPLLGDHLKAVSDALTVAIEHDDQQSPVALRDRAALLVGWHCALRRSEIAALRVSSVEFLPEGMKIYIGRSKTDQEGRGRTLWIRPVRSHVNACPVAAVRAWLQWRGETEGALFYHARRWTLRRAEPMPAWQVTTMIDRWTRRAGIEPESPGSSFSPHSLRSGFITQALRRGRPAKETMEHSGHGSYETFFGYVRTATGFEATVQKDILEDE